MRRVEISRDLNFANLGELATHPNVKKSLHILGDYTLFEFSDPVYEAIDDPRGALSDPRNWTDDDRLKLSKLVERERSILAPLYRDKPRHWQGNILFLPLETTLYRVLDSKNINWPWFACFPRWETESEIRIEGRLRQASIKHQDELNSF